MAASSSSGLRWKYDVFINFRGEDTRRGFVSHLNRALRQKPINTFIDAEELRKGDRLSELLTPIRESRLSIVVFTQNYASSTWCLKELVEIMECKDTKNQIVLPIFYQVDPSDVRKLKRSFAKAFTKHELRSNVDVEEVQSWRSALARATDLSSWDSQNYKDDAELIEKIVEDVFRKLIHISSTSSKDNGLVEMDSHMHEMHLLLYPPGVETNVVRIVGIWGMGGLGKTTIARAVYDDIASRFEACCFLENVKEGFMKRGELHMQTKLLSSISGNKVRSSAISNKGFQVMLKSLGQRKVLLVVDDVDKLTQIEALLGKQHSFGCGSRIIITTRDVELLSRADAKYRPNIFSDPGALELFRRYAFRTNQPTKDYDDLSRLAIKYARGLPLALIVLGAFLDNKTVCEWRDVLEKVGKVPQRGVDDVLKTSFDGLDDIEKDIFLDIACFFKGMEKDYATEILDSCGFYPHTGIRVLFDRALITVSRGKLEMHDLLEEMGREIVRQQSIKEPGRRSRLWSYEDVHHVLTKNTATEAVESIILDLSNSDEVCLNAEVFVSMTQLRLLKICGAYGKQHMIGHLKFLSHELRCLSWCGFPLKSFPSNCQFKNLVDLDMRYSLIDRLWEGTQALEKLKFINLSYCLYLKETPDFTKMPNLEKLILQGCISLVEVHPSISALTNLVLLNLKGCRELKSLSSNIRMKSLKILNLQGCFNFEKFPEILEVIEELKELDLSGLKIKKLPLSIGNLTGLCYLGLKDCKELKSLPSSICMKSLKTLNLSGCSNLQMFPEILEVMEELPELNLSGSKIKELPLSINNLTGLRYLGLKDCKELKSLPSSICRKSFKTLDLSGCSSLEMFPDILEVMEELQELNLSGTKIKELPLSINNLTGLCHLGLKDCKELKSLPSSICRKSFKTLDLSGCSSFEMFPDILEVMEELQELNLSGSKIKELPLSIDNLTGLRYLGLKDCKELKSLPSSICRKYFKTLDLSGCSSLEMFPDISEVMEELQELNLSGSKIKELPLSINNLKELGYLNLKDCKELKSLPSSFCQLKSLTYVTLSGCTKFEVFPNIVENMEGLRELHLDGTSIKELSPWIERLQGLEYLNLKNCKSLVHLPDTLCNLARLLALNLCGRPNLSQLPVNLVRLWDNAVEIDNYHTDIVTGMQRSHTSLASTTELRSESLTREQHSQTSTTSSKDNGLVEMDSHMHEMHLLLYPPGVETNDVRVVGIWGMGGLGKTTIAGAVYDEIASLFEACCFLENVKEGFMKHGKLYMQTQLLSSISNNKVGSSDISSKGFQVMLNSLSQRKILIVVDDVDKLEQIEALLGEQHSFGGGSRIIITTRDVQLLSRADAIYRPKFFSDAGALELLRRHAFITNQPTRDYDDLLRCAVKYAQGLPLALEVLGAFLDNKTVREWEVVLENVRIIPQRAIHDVLKTSFDGLDDTEKDIFLDIACFFKGMKKDHAIEILGSCGFYPHTGIRVLIDRALITVSGEGELEMHDSLEKMGREIVRQESIKEPGRRSRLWSYEDVHHVLTQNTATEAVESIILDLSNSDVVFLSAKAFISMTRLRLLKISHKYCILKYNYFVLQHLIGHLKFLSGELRCLSWIGFPLKSLPSNFRFKNLVDLDMQYSLIDRLWEGTQTLENLRSVNLSHCQYLEKTPDFSKVPNLGTLILQGCISLVEVHPSIPTLTNLYFLDLNGCGELKILASSICMKSLKTLNLSGCSSLEMFPEISEVMEELLWLNLSGSKVKKLPSSINNLTGLSYLLLKDCKDLKSLPSIIHMKSLETLDLSGCSSLEMFPEIPEVMEKLSKLNLSGSKIKELPSSINNLMGLSCLGLKDCKEFKSLPSSICQLESLRNVTLSGCTKFELHLDGTSIKDLSPSIERLQGLEVLNMRDCRILVHPGGCTNLSQLPVNFEDLVLLWDSAVEIDNWDTDILTRILYS